MAQGQIFGHEQGCRIKGEDLTHVGRLTLEEARQNQNAASVSDSAVGPLRRSTAARRRRATPALILSKSASLIGSTAILCANSSAGEDPFLLAQALGRALGQSWSMLGSCAPRWCPVTVRPR